MVLDDLGFEESEESVMPQATHSEGGKSPSLAMRQCFQKGPIVNIHRCSQKG